MKLTRARNLIRAATAAAAVAAATLTAAPASAGGVNVYNRPVCHARFIPVDLGHGDYFNVFNSPAANTCINTERHRLAWQVTSWWPAAHGWQYPNISAGTEWGTYTCADGRSAQVSSPGSRCMRFPVRQEDDGTPLTSARTFNHLDSGNVAYDMWFNRTWVAPRMTGQDDGAEIMIWLAHPGVPVPRAAICWHARIQDRPYTVLCWRAHNHGVTWNYVAFVAGRQTGGLPPTWLNGFFRNAIAHRLLSRSWWLTSIDFGAEINAAPRRRPVFDVGAYSLTGVR